MGHSVFRRSDRPEHARRVDNRDPSLGGARALCFLEKTRKGLAASRDELRAVIKRKAVRCPPCGDSSTYAPALLEHRNLDPGGVKSRCGDESGRPCTDHGDTARPDMAQLR